jgi:hypothetical protein
MKRLVGVKINKLDFLPIKQGDLLYHEGPLLSVFKDALSDNFYFYKWSDRDEKTHRWLVFKVSHKALSQFFDKKLSLRQLITEQPFSYLLDIDNNIEPIQIVIVSTPNMPKTYLPDADSYFDTDDFESYAAVLQKQIKEQRLELA